MLPKFRAVVEIEGVKKICPVLTMEWSLTGQIMSVTPLLDWETPRQFLIEECEALLTCTPYLDKNGADCGKGIVY
jgi:hypothetical protein